MRVVLIKGKQGIVVAANPLFIRRLDKLLAVHRCDQVEDNVARMIYASLLVDSKIAGLSEKETADMILSMSSGHPGTNDVSGGLVIGLLTEKDQFAKYFQLLVNMSDNWISALSAVNMVIIDSFTKVQEPVKEALFAFFREAVGVNVPKLDSVLMHVIRTLNGAGDWNSKIRLAYTMAKFLLDSEQYLLSHKPGSFLFATIVSTLGHLIVDIPYGHMDNVRQALINVCLLCIRKRPVECAVMGRELVFLLMRLAKVPQFSKIWEELVNTPAKFQLKSIDELMFRTAPQYFAVNRLPYEMVKKIDFTMGYVRNPQDKHFEWFNNTYLRGPDAASVRLEIIRHCLNTVNQNNINTDTRMQFVYFILTNAATGPDMQMCKTAIWLDYILHDSACPVSVLETVMALLLFTLNHHPHLTNSLLEYACKTVQQLHPPSVDRLRHAFNTAMRVVAERYANTAPIGGVLESSRLDRPVKDVIREVLPDFLRPLPVVMVPNNSGATASPSDEKKRSASAGAGNATPSTPTAGASASPSLVEADSPEREVLEEIPSANNKAHPVDSIEGGKSPSPPSGRSRNQTKEEIEKDIESNYQMLRDDIKPIVASLREAFQSEESDDSEKGDAVQRLLVRLLESADSVDEDQLELMSQCLLGLLGRPVEYGKSLVPESTSEEALQESCAHPLFIIFRNLCFTPSNDTTSRAPLVTIIASMRDRDNTITYTMLYFMKAGIYTTCNSDAKSSYVEVARACDKDVHVMLAEDLEQCALDDDRLFTFIMPYVFEKFAQEVGGAPDVFKVVCHHIDANQLMELIGAVVRENITLFRRDSFCSILSSSFSWETTAQWVLWQLIHAEGIPVDWVTQLIPKLDSMKNPEAATNVILMLKRIDREPTMGLMRAILSRPILAGDTMVVNCIKVLIEDTDMCVRVAELIGSLMKKQLNSSDIHLIASTSKSQGKKQTPQKLSLEQVLLHLEFFTQLCLTKERRLAEALLSKWTIQEAFGAVKTFEKAASLRPKFTQLFAVMDILAEDSPQGQSRTLRGNRGGTGNGSSTGGSSTKQSKNRKEEEREDDTPNKKKRRQVITIDSDSD